MRAAPCSACASVTEVLAARTALANEPRRRPVVVPASAGKRARAMPPRANCDLRKFPSLRFHAAGTSRPAPRWLRHRAGSTTLEAHLQGLLGECAMFCSRAHPRPRRLVSPLDPAGTILLRSSRLHPGLRIQASCKEYASKGVAINLRQQISFGGGRNAQDFPADRLHELLALSATNGATSGATRPRIGLNSGRQAAQQLAVAASVSESKICIDPTAGPLG